LWGYDHRLCSAKGSTAKWGLWADGSSGYYVDEECTSDATFNHRLVRFFTIKANINKVVSPGQSVSHTASAACVSSNSITWRNFTIPSPAVNASLTC
jgi:hypothetical protein